MNTEKHAAQIKSIGEMLGENKPQVEEETPKAVEAEESEDYSEETAEEESSKEIPSKEEVDDSSDEASSDSEPKSKKSVSLDEHENIKKALQAERKIRQKAERELQRIKSRSSKRSDDEDVWEDDNTSEEEKPSATTKSKMSYEERLAMISCNMWRKVHPDASENFDAFDEYVDQNPTAWEQFLNAEDPGQFAYEVGGRVLFRKKYGDSPEEIRKNIEKEILEGKSSTPKKSINLKTKKDLGDKLPANISGSTRAKSGSETAQIRVKDSKEMWG